MITSLIRKKYFLYEIKAEVVGKNIFLERQSAYPLQIPIRRNGDERFMIDTFIDLEFRVVFQVLGQV